MVEDFIDGNPGAMKLFDRALPEYDDGHGAEGVSERVVVVALGFINSDDVAILVPETQMGFITNGTELGREEVSSIKN